MTPWEFIWVAASWLISGVLVFIMVVLALALLLGVLRGMRSWFHPKRKS